MSTVSTAWNGEQLFSSKSVEWSTPQALFDLLDAEFGGFELDAAATARNTLCPDFIGVNADALETAWVRPGMERKLVWLNPPWGRNIGAWVSRAADQAHKHGLTVVCVLPASTDTAWWHGDVMQAAQVRFIRGRLHFVRDDGHTGPCTKGAAIVVFTAWGGPPTFTSMVRP